MSRIDSYDALIYVLENTKWKTMKIEKENVEMKRTPSKQQYEEALEVIKKYEDRQSDLARLNKELGHLLGNNFNQIKFEVNKSKKEITFTGVTKEGKLKLGKSTARSGDKFEEVIGKLIAVKAVLGMDIKDVEKYIESDNLDTGWGVITAGSINNITLSHI
ncbi:hypothetical protein [Oceanobacillus sp. FSL H7-0719]|uniref:hypothetical protein n=1 Tax=Oceanobacillus sp. FSL H7-0719 TaxID=2954507 RepID=UPI00324818BB